MTIIFLDWIMVNTFASRLYKRLRLEMGMIYSIHSVRQADDDGNFLYGFRTSVSKKEYIPAVLREIRAQCQSMMETLVTPQEMRAVKNQIAMSFRADNNQRLDPSFWIDEYKENFRLDKPIIPRKTLYHHFMSLRRPDLKQLAIKVFNNKTLTQIGIKKD